MESRMIIDEYGTKRWYNENDQLHREDGPAVIESDGSEIWYLNGQRHRDDGPAMIWSDGSEWWFRNGSLHRTNRPNGEECWFRNGLIHRTDGPAITRRDGKIEWWLNDKRYSFAKWADALNLDQKTRLEMVMVWDIS